MKQKYFLRGFGIGLITATLFLFVLYSYQTSDTRVIARAKELGMAYIQEEQTKEGEKNVPDETSKESEEDVTRETPKEAEETVSVSVTETMVTLEIPSGMNSIHVAEMLEQAELVEDASSFDYYLMEHGLTQVIQYGIHELRVGMNYRELAQNLTGVNIEN